jgi:Fic-DOC domain mobile mystery protein B
MFGDTWRWAGSFRSTERNIGIAPEQIATRLRDLLDDARYWAQHGTYPVDEAAARFHHRLVSIHCFANGNGRHARLLTDLLLRANGAAPFSWGRSDLVHAGVARDRYLAALRAADTGNIDPLIEFARRFAQ